MSTFRRRQTAAIANRKEIESLFQAISDSNNCIQQMLPNDKKDDMNNIVSFPICGNLVTLHCVVNTKIMVSQGGVQRGFSCLLQVKELKTRMEVLGKTDERLGMIENFNTRLGVFNDAVTEMENWIGDARYGIKDDFQYKLIVCRILQ